MKNTVEQFLGLWVDRNGNVLLIKSPEANTVKVSFASGKIMSPIERCSMHQQLTIDVESEYDTLNTELIVQFGVRYFEPKLHLKYEIADQYKGNSSLKPFYKLPVSTPLEKKEWLKWFEPLENYFLIEGQKKIEAILLAYKLNSM